MIRKDTIIYNKKKKERKHSTSDTLRNSCQQNPRKIIKYSNVYEATNNSIRKGKKN